MKQPLASRMRPYGLDQFVGQQHLLGSGQVLRIAAETGYIHSCLLWGPPGIGKTSLAQIMCRAWGARCAYLSAVSTGVKDIREIVKVSKDENSPLICFIDEIHRFNKAQQDALLPAVESGELVLMASTTENPSFALNNALLSRLSVYVLYGLTEAELSVIIRRALQEDSHLAPMKLFLGEGVEQSLLKAGDNDARQTLNLLEQISYLAEKKADGTHRVEKKHLKQFFKRMHRKFDFKGDYFYDQISALHKSIRGSNPDAALYWLGRMLDGGADPLYIGRRLIRIALEDIGNADPRALSISTNALSAYQNLGSPEGDLALAQVATYLACAPKSNAVYRAYKRAMIDVEQYGSLDVPIHLRNAPSSLMKTLGHGQHYHYAHDHPDAYSPGQHYLPKELINKCYYRPVSRGLEIKIKEKLKYLNQLDQQEKKERIDDD